MAISSRLALWEQKIREEDKSPPPSSPPPLFSVIPGGFIKQLVRETEKEAKEARQRKQLALAAPERETPEISISEPNSKSSSGTRSGSQQISQDNQSSSPGSSDILSKESEGTGSPNPERMTSINGEKAQELGSTATPAKKTLPFKRGMRRGDVLLMVAKLDLDSAKPERTHPHDTSPCKTPPPVTDTGKERKGETSRAPCGPQASTEILAPKAEKTRTGGLGDAGQGTVALKKGEKGQSIVGKGGGTPKTKELKEAEPQGKDRQGTRPQAQGPSEGVRPGKAEKEGGEPTSPVEKENVSKNVGSEGKHIGPHIPGRKWGGFLGRRSKWDGPQNKKDKEGVLLSKAEKTGEPQTQTEKKSQMQGELGDDLRMGEKAGELRSMTGKAGESWDKKEKIGQPQGKSGKAGEARSQTEKGCEAPKEVSTMVESPVAAGKGGWSGRSGQEAEGPCSREDVGSGALETELEGPSQPALEKDAERPRIQKENQDGPAPQEAGKGGQSRNSEQAPEDRWYEAEKVWLAQKDGFTLATVLKPDEGTADLPAGRVRLCIDADKSITEVDEEHVHRANPPELDQAEDLASLISVNESSVLNTLLQRYRAQRPHTCTGPDLIVLQPRGPSVPSAGKVPKGRWDGLPAHIGSMAQRAYWALLNQRRDQSIVALGRSGAGKTACCEQVLEHLVGMAGSMDGKVSVEKIRATFTVLRAFGSVSMAHSCSATRFSMVMSLDFNATGRITAAQLQTMLLEKSRVARQPEGESNFQVFSQMLAGLDLDLRMELNLHQMADSSSFGMGMWSKPEDKQKAAAAFAQLQGAMETLGISESEQRAIWRVLAAIYHLGAAGACKGGSKIFEKVLVHPFRRPHIPRPWVRFL
ncbi:unconventional myosin-XVIIIb-like [Rhinopithecus roxellana]|uniref:unconventional myosin-XVIIIb-like n=1 Tax=Rhinopithecus roxellana TaxID=61622 RepID=UPI0012370E32|nr:unconventional myosin-XVIIIb-like [Rhinopithecus roxellana]